MFFPLRSLSFLLAEELEDGGKILVSVASRAHDSVDLVGQGTQRDGGLCVGGGVLGQTEILLEAWERSRKVVRKDHLSTAEINVISTGSEIRG